MHALANVASVDVSAARRRSARPRRSTLRCRRTSRSSRPRKHLPEFHARFSARSRSYRYRIWRSRTRSPFEARRSWWYPRPLDVPRLEAQAAALIGEHDFRAFTRTETHHQTFVRTVEAARWIDDGDVLLFEITADAFLRHMVRTLVGTMVDEIDVTPLLEGRRAPTPAARHRRTRCTS